MDHENKPAAGHNQSCGAGIQISSSSSRLLNYLASAPT